MSGSIDDYPTWWLTLQPNETIDINDIYIPTDWQSRSWPTSNVVVESADSYSCSIEFQVFLWTVIIIIAAFSISSLYYIFRFILNRIQTKDAKISNCSFYSGLIFFIISSITLIIWNILIASRCYDFDEFAYFSLLITAWILYAYVQLYLLWVVMFIRLYFVFEDSAFALKRGTVILSICLFACLPILMLIVYVILLVLSVVGLGNVQIVWFLFLFYGLISLAFSFVFVSKLYQILKLSPIQSIDNGLLKAITKTTILALISFIMTAVMTFMIFLIGDGVSRHKSLWLLQIMLIIMDIYSNFICVVLTYKMFDNQYRRCCGCADEKCRKCLFFIANYERFETATKKHTHVDSIEISCTSPTN